jgi:hypothetical protein
LALVGYIVEEALLTAGESETHSQQTALDKMESRLPLLLQFTSGGQEMAAVTRYLVDVMSAKTALSAYQVFHRILKPNKTNNYEYIGLRSF